MSVTVFHGSNVRIERPDCRKGRAALDFGQGFYVTDIREQAAEWAGRVADNHGGEAVVNVYSLDREAVLKEGRCKVFTAYDEAWLEYIVKNRQGMPVEDYDFVEGGVADDRVIDSVRLYMLGLMSLDVTLRRLAMHKPNNQICLRNQALTDKYLKFNGTETV